MSFADMTPAELVQLVRLHLSTTPLTHSLSRDAATLVLLLRETVNRYDHAIDVVYELSNDLDTALGSIPDWDWDNCPRFKSAECILVGSCQSAPRCES